MPRAKYVSYYDCSAWNSTVEIMNIQNYRTKCVIVVYNRDGAPLWSDSLELNPHETRRVQIDPRVGGALPREGLVEVFPAEEQVEEEFPSMLIIADQGRHPREANRYAPFIRVPEEPQR